MSTNPSLQKLAATTFQKLQEIEFHSLGTLGLKGVNSNEYSTKKKQLFEQTLATQEENIRHILYEEFFELGPLSRWLEDTTISEILVNSWDSIWIERAGTLVEAPNHFLTPETFSQIFYRLCEQAEIQTHFEKPMGSKSWRCFRITVTTPPISESHTLSLRRKGSSCYSLKDLESENFATPTQVRLLNSALETKKTLLFIGSTGSGKTTLMNAYLKQIPRDQRVVTIEDTDELSFPNPVSTKLFTREQTQEGNGQVSLSDLVQISLRLRPDRIAVGEVRGPEAKDLLMAISTGHKGSCGTLHADDPKTALLRLEMLVQLGAPQWGIDAIRQLIFLNIDWIVLCRRDLSTGQRHLAGIFSIEGLESIGFLTEEISE